MSRHFLFFDDCTRRRFLHKAIRKVPRENKRTSVDGVFEGGEGGYDGLALGGDELGGGSDLVQSADPIRRFFLSNVHPCAEVQPRSPPQKSLRIGSRFSEKIQGRSS